MIKFLKQLWFLLSVDCETSAHLTSDSCDRQLNWAEHWGMKMHRVICSKSRTLDQQIEFLNTKIAEGLATSQTVGQAPAQSTEYRLSTEARSRILLRIRQTE